jgi:hypothetical protein
MNSVRSIVLVTTLTFLFAPVGMAQEQLGKVTFPTSCDPKVQAQFERGVAMLHSYWFTEAGKVFDAVAKQDPNCVMAYWGYAVNLLGNSLANPPPAKAAQMAWDALEKARAVGAKTQRERDWIEALSAYYRDHDKISVDDRLLAYTKAMEQMTQRYPDDFEAWAYYALTLQASAPKTDKTYANQLKSAAILEKLYKQNPQHPGVSHYLIHAYDYPPLADKGIEAARRYAGIAPAAPHARHMPSHIYSMVGLWEESIASNRSALQVQNDYYHATDFMVYAYLQLAQDAKAKSLIDEMYKAGRDDLLLKEDLPNLGAYTALAVIPTRYALERGDWKGAATLPAVPTKRLMADSLIRFARGLGMARSGDIAGAKREVEAIQGIQKALLKAKDSYWAARSGEQVLAVSAWVAHAEGAREQAVKLSALLRTAKTAASNTCQWRTASTQCGSCLPSCYWKQGRQRRRSESSKRRSRKIPTATADSTEPRVPPRRPAIAKKPGLTTPSLWRSAQKPTPIVPRSLRRRHFWRRSEPILET